MPNDYRLDPYENTQRDEVQDRGHTNLSGSPSPAEQPSSSPPSGLPSFARGHFGKAMVLLSWIVLVYAWLVAGKLDRLPQWVPPLFMVLIMLPFGVWERLGAAAIEAAASKIAAPGSPKK